MTTSITEDILSSNRLYTDIYLKDTINLTKSIVIKNDKEAKLYNEHLELMYPDHIVDLTEKATWRYYKHLSGQLHPVDKPMEIISIDNGERIELTTATTGFHKNTHIELLSFSYYYQELVDRYPEQELLIKTIISTSKKKTTQVIIDSLDYTIVNYNSKLIESNEDEIIYKLQQRIDNYKVTQLLNQYTITDSLFLASQYHVLYSYIVTTLLSLRLENAKTPRAHSFHILNYLSSHHYLDLTYRHLTKKQALYLYRNLLFLNNHSGSNLVQGSLIENLFQERNISVVNYQYEQTNRLNEDNSMEYLFKQKLMNKTDLVFNQSDYTLKDLSNKERNKAKNNISTYKYTTKQVNDKLLYSLSNRVLTKDLETIVTGVTDAVKYKLIPTLVDYWAFLIKQEKINFLVSITDPVKNSTITLRSRDLFKLYTLLLYKNNNLKLTRFPNYTVKRVFKEILPETKDLHGTYYRPHHYHRSQIETIRAAIPTYPVITTAFEFSEYISDIYKLNIGLWLLESNTHDRDDNGQILNVIGNLLTDTQLELNDEPPMNFLTRIGMEGLYDYPNKITESMVYNILNSLFDNKLDFLNKYSSIQKVLVTIFQKFTSYTTQMLDEYSQESAILAGTKDTRVTIDQSEIAYNFMMPSTSLVVDMKYQTGNTSQVVYEDEILHSNRNYSYIHLSIISRQLCEFTKHNNVFVNISPKATYVKSRKEWMMTPSSQKDLNFLVFNPLD